LAKKKIWPKFFFFFQKILMFALGAKTKHLISEPLYIYILYKYVEYSIFIFIFVDGPPQPRSASAPHAHTYAHSRSPRWVKG